MLKIAHLAKKKNITKQSKNISKSKYRKQLLNLKNMQIPTLYTKKDIQEVIEATFYNAEASQHVKKLALALHKIFSTDYLPRLGSHATGKTKRELFLIFLESVIETQFKQ